MSDVVHRATRLCDHLDYFDRLMEENDGVIEGEAAGLDQFLESATPEMFDDLDDYMQECDATMAALKQRAKDLADRAKVYEARKGRAREVAMKLLRKLGEDKIKTPRGLLVYTKKGAERVEKVMETDPTLLPRDLQRCKPAVYEEDLKAILKALKAGRKDVPAWYRIGVGDEQIVFKG